MSDMRQATADSCSEMPGLGGAGIYGISLDDSTGPRHPLEGMRRGMTSSRHLGAGPRRRKLQKCYAISGAEDLSASPPHPT
jgi:hypothetical protein